MTFKDELEQLINRHSMENGSNTPDFVLAKYLTACLAAFDNATRDREEWYGRNTQVGQAPPSTEPPPVRERGCLACAGAELSHDAGCQYAPRY